MEGSLDREEIYKLNKIEKNDKKERKRMERERGGVKGGIMFCS